MEVRDVPVARPALSIVKLVFSTQALPFQYRVELLVVPEATDDGIDIVDHLVVVPVDIKY